MILSATALILSVWLGGLATLFLKRRTIDIRVPLVFAGSFLFSVTIIHIVPELFAQTDHPHEIGLWVLGGFFFQRLLEYYSRGVEHGHAHSQDNLSNANQFSILLALFIHSFSEGALLTHESPFHEQHESYSLLLGIVVHKAPAAFALMVILINQKSKWIQLAIFSLASPIGLILSTTVALSPAIMTALVAVVCGSFLHISTTIFVEANPQHEYGWKQTMVSLTGAAVAILSDYLF